uniref:Uncharacterized protein n=1 Tax=Chromera velia CCMP2878 TaxID=1169474 RepID=A0A0G4GWF8_9ALVE|eukprot:Cvel_5321.t1-p1 / transcript=Cvel_5321.t1 / gene=Cvel_5321 / organism=Chromera_velia_CCMP2878 / gene_product=hypothetical protein / transcript_product=hypothetical protein / location=Cvel_scaffold246:94405-94740(+) / protein_length=112 / sequence_SO=supercontig / SO=protein_coding / is_pseudo=false
MERLRGVLQTGRSPLQDIKLLQEFLVVFCAFLSPCRLPGHVEDVPEGTAAPCPSQRGRASKMSPKASLGGLEGAAAAAAAAAQLLERLELPLLVFQQPLMQNPDRRTKGGGM